MGATATVRVMTAEEIVAKAGGQTPFLHPPARSTVFAERAMRLRQLARGHAMGDFLLFMADLAQAQQVQLDAFPAVPLPDAAALDHAARLGAPPLPAAEWPRDPAWRAALKGIVADLRPRAPAGAQAVLAALATAGEDGLEQQAEALLGSLADGLDLAAAPIIAAALQVTWTHMVCALESRGDQSRAFGRTDDETSCPCCGSRPTASLTRTAGDSLGQRYLHCSLCSMQWHYLRIRCSHCGSDEHVAYQSLERADADASGRAAQASIQAETCEDCGHYLKIVHSDRDPFVDPVADDLASLTLDLLVSEAGMRRHGINLMLLFGEADPPPDPGAA